MDKVVLVLFVCIIDIGCMADELPNDFANHIVSFMFIRICCFSF